MSTAQTAQPLSLRQLLGFPAFRRLWLAQCISDFGDSMTMLGLLLLINALTGSAAAVATLLIVMAVPQIVVGLVAGVYVDRLNRKAVMIGADLIRGLVVLGFIAVQRADQLWLIFGLAALQAAVGTFFTPARSALLPAVVPGEGLLAANSALEISRVICGLLGTAAAGLLVGGLHAYWPAFALDALTFGIAVLLVAGLRVDSRPTAASAGGLRTILGELGAGLRIIWRTNALLGTLVAMGVAMLGLGAVNVLLVRLIINDLQVPPTWFAGIEFAQTSAMVLSGGLVAMLARRFRPQRIVVWGLLGLAGLICALAMVSSVWHLLGILFGVGWIITPLQASTATITQTAVADELRGRSAAARNTAISLASVVSMGAAGILAQAIGLRSVFVLAGAITVLAALGAGLIFRRGLGESAAGTTSPIPLASDAEIAA
jgi:MFS family permease